MRTDDKVIAGTNRSIDNNINTRDQMRVGIWFLVVLALAILGLFSLGDSHAPSSGAHTQEPNDMSGAGANPTHGSMNPPRYDVNRPVGVIEWPGQVGKQTKYLTGHGNTPATSTPQTGVSGGVTPNTATDEASRMKAGSGATPSDSMPTQGSPTATTTHTGTGTEGTTSGGSAGGH